MQESNTGKINLQPVPTSDSPAKGTGKTLPLHVEAERHYCIANNHENSNPPTNNPNPPGVADKKATGEPGNEGDEFDSYVEEGDAEEADKVGTGLRRFRA